jgi:sulfite dehydrogenase (quinone) subunit SoeC
MRPAISVIVFTVLSGAGLGLFAVLALGDVLGGGHFRADRTQWQAGLFALILVAVGLMSSTLHLANPRNAWRAASQFRYSWLSREAVLAIAFFPVGALYLAAVAIEASFAMRASLALCAVLLAWGILFCTGMIYACLKTIPRWNTPIVPLCYVLFGHLSGMLIALAMLAIDGGPDRRLIGCAMALLVASVIAKGAHYLRFRASQPGTHTLTKALGVTAAAAKLLDVGHAQRTFLTQEFMFRVGREYALALRCIFLVLGFLIPLLTLVYPSREPAHFVIAAFSCLAGLLVERWLFFAEAQHVVRLYHGQQRVS